MAMCVGGPAVLVPVAAAAGGAPVAETAGEGAQEMCHELGKATVLSAWGEEAQRHTPALRADAAA